jgi:hypothetical protein
MSVLAAHVGTLLAGGTPGSKDNPIYVKQLGGTSPYVITLVTAAFAVITAIIGSLAAFILASHTQENRDRIQRLSTERANYFERDQKLWAFTATADDIIERLNGIGQLNTFTTSSRLLNSYNASEIMLLAAGSGLGFDAVQPLIPDAYKLREAIDSYKNSPTQDAMENLKDTAELIADHLKNARESASTLRTQIVNDLNIIAVRMSTKPERKFFGLGSLKNLFK